MPLIERFFSRFDVYLTPVLRRLPAKIGEYAPTVQFQTLLDRCIDHITYTPLHNALGTPAMSVPLAMSAGGLPIGAQFAASVGDERTLLELAYELEAARPWANRWPSMSAATIH
jgi:amidase